MSQEEKDIIKDASKKIDYLAFSYYRSNVISSFEDIKIKMN